MCVCVCVCVLPLDLRDFKILLSRQAIEKMVILMASLIEPLGIMYTKICIL